MGAALWADVVAAGLGGGSVREPSKSGTVWGAQLRGARGHWGLGRVRGSRMITGLAARRGALTPWAGKEAGAWMGSQRVGCWSSPSAQDELGRLGLGTGRGWKVQGGRRTTCDLFVDSGGLEGAH